MHLDTLSLAKYTGSKLFIVVSGEEDSILDDLLFLKRHVDLAGVKLAGVIINKVQHLDEFQSTHLPAIQKEGIRVIGVLPYPERTDLLFGLLPGRSSLRQSHYAGRAG